MRHASAALQATRHLHTHTNSAIQQPADLEIKICQRKSQLLACHLNHVPFFKFIKNLQTLYPAEHSVPSAVQPTTARDRLQAATLNADNGQNTMFSSKVSHTHTASEPAPGMQTVLRPTSV